MKGLIIGEPWIDMILDGTKHIEIRGSNTNIRGTIALIKSGSGKVYGTVELIDSIRLEHLSLNDSSPGYVHPYAWVLQNPIRCDEPIPYQHPQGALIWVNLHDVGQLKKLSEETAIRPD